MAFDCDSYPGYSNSECHYKQALSLASLKELLGKIRQMRHQWPYPKAISMQLGNSERETFETKCGCGA